MNVKMSQSIELAFCHCASQVIVEIPKPTDGVLTFTWMTGKVHVISTAGRKKYLSVSLIAMICYAC